MISSFRRRWMSCFLRGVIEAPSGGAGFYSSVYVVPKYTSGLWVILNFKQFNHYLHMTFVRKSSIQHVWQLIQHGDHAFPIDVQDAY